MHAQTQPLKFLSDAARMLLANSNLLSAVNNVVTVAQHLLPKCPDTNPFCRSHETERIQLTLRVLASHLEQAAKDPCLAKPVHHAGEALQKLRVTLQKKAEDQEDPEVGKVLEGLDQALAEVQSILADIERRASFVNIALTWGEEEEGTDNPSDETDGKLLLLLYLIFSQLLGLIALR